MAAASFPNYHVTGAVFHFIRTPTSGAIFYLGTCEIQPEVQIVELASNVMNDEAGKILPGQKCDQGQMANIGLSLTRYSETTYRYLNTPMGTNNGISVAVGHRGRFSRGALKFGGYTFELWQVFENSLNPAYRGQQPIGWYWPQVELLAQSFPKIGTQEKIYQLALEAQPWKIPQQSINGVSGYERSWVLWQEDDGAFPADVLVPQ